MQNKKEIFSPFQHRGLGCASCSPTFESVCGSFPVGHACLAVTVPLNRLSLILAPRHPQIITRKSHFTAHLHPMLSLGSLPQLVIGQGVRIKQVTEQEVPRIWMPACWKRNPAPSERACPVSIYLTNPKGGTLGWDSVISLESVVVKWKCFVSCCCLLLKTYPLVGKLQKNKMRVKTYTKSAVEKCCLQCLL